MWRETKTVYHVPRSKSFFSLLQEPVRRETLRLVDHYSAEPAHTQIGRTLAELSIEWIAGTAARRQSLARFPGRYLPLMPCPAATRSASPSACGLQTLRIANQKTHHSPPPDYPPAHGVEADISTLR
jgi:hypothetical protein